MSGELKSGQIVDYPYLWGLRPSKIGMEEAVARSRCVILAVQGTQDGLTHLLLLAIVTQLPGDERLALEIPAIERRRSGLNDSECYWIILDEYNYDVAEWSWYIEPDYPVFGNFGRSFMTEIASFFLDAASHQNK